MKKLVHLMCAAAAVFAFTGCATTVPVTVTRPAELDLHGAQTISVLPFQLSGSENAESAGGGTTIIINLRNIFKTLGGTNPDEKAAANYMTASLTQKLSDSNYIQVIDSAVVQKAIEKSTSAPVDVYLTGRISRFDSNISERRTTEERDSKKYTVTWYTRTVNATVTYQIVDAKTAQVISYRTQSLEESSGETEYYRNLEKPFDIVRSSLEELTNRIMRELQPYEVIKRISLLSDKTKDPDMKAADKMVKNGLVAQAETKYLSLYKTGHVFTAGYNAARLMQARGKLQEAEQLMTELVETYSDKRAMSALRDIEYEISQAKKLQRQESARYL